MHDSLYILAGISPPKIRRLTAAQKERLQQTKIAGICFMTTYNNKKDCFSKKLCDIQTLITSPESAWITAWTDYINSLHNSEDVQMGIKPSENLPLGHHVKWTRWKSLNRLRTGYGRAAALMHHWGSSFCSCGDLQTMQHLILCEKLNQTCTTAGIHMRDSTAIETALYRADTKWKHTLAYKRDTKIYILTTLWNQVIFDNPKWKINSREQRRKLSISWINNDYLQIYWD